MTPQIKQRIEQIRRGEVPDGYKRTKAGIMPLDWCAEKEYKAKDIFKSVTNKKHNGEFEVLSATQDKGVVPRNQVDIDIKYDEANITGYKKVDCGDFVISLRSFQGGIEYSEYEGLVSPAYTVLKPVVPISDGYYKAYLKTGDYINRLNKGTYGIRDGKQIGFEDFGDMILHYPPLPEQQKIAEILSAQDKLIALKEKLIEEKKRQKKALMQQLLTGKKRLPGFSGEWMASKIKDITEISAGATPDTNNPEFWGGNIKWMNSGELNNKHIYDVVGRITETGLSKTSTKLLPQKCVLIGLAGQGKTRGTAAINYIELCTNQSIAAIHPCDMWIPEFLYYSLDMRYDELRMISSGDGTRGGLNLKLIGDLIVKYPSYDEQEAIANVLSTTDKEISLLQKDLDQEKQKKKALMQLLLTGILRV